MFRSLAMTSMCRKQYLRSLRDAYGAPAAAPAVQAPSHTPLRSVMGEEIWQRIPKNKTPSTFVLGVFFFRSLAMTYSHMGKPHTTIGDASFHF